MLFFSLFLGLHCFLGGVKLDFINWYKRRICRIYPTLIAVGFIASLVFCYECSFLEIMLAKKYWFIQCILICYILLYPVIRYRLNLKLLLAVSLCIMTVSFFTLFDFHGQMFYGINNYFRWILYFTIMLVGGYIYLNSDKIKYHPWSILALLICIICWYAINFVAYGSNFSNFALFSYIPLVGICYFTYELGKAPWIEKMFSRRIAGNILFITGNLCLDSYLIQNYLFTDALNHLFPLNIPIIIVLVLVLSLIHI